MEEDITIYGLWNENVHIYITVNNIYIPASNRDIYLDIDKEDRLRMKRYE